METELTPEQELAQAQEELRRMEQEEIDKLEKELSEPEVAEATETATETAETTDTSTDDVDLDEAALAVFMRMSPEKRVEYAKKMGLETVDKKTNDQEKQEIAKGAAKLGAQESVQAVRGMVSPDELPDGFDELDEDEQNLIVMDLVTKKRAKELFEQELAPIREQERKKQIADAINKTSQEWATGLGVPEAAQPIMEELSKLSEDELGLYVQQSQNGGGWFVDAVMNKAKSIADEVQKSKETTVEQPLPKAEETSGKTNAYEAKLPPEAQRMIDQMKASGQFTDDVIAETKKQLASELQTA